MGLKKGRHFTSSNKLTKDFNHPLTFDIAMKYQLVLQWPATCIKDYDTMLGIEGVLSEKLSSDSEVDGHDAGSGEMNIFIHTNDPGTAFNEVKAALGSGDFWINARVAYREIDGSDYIVLWPKDLHEFKVT